MKLKILYLIIILSNFKELRCQIEKNSKGHFGMGGGFKNPYGSWGAFYSRNIQSLPFEFKFGVGKRQSPSLMLGTNYSIWNNSKQIEILLNLDYSYNLSGEIDYKVNSSYTDNYKYSSIQFIHPYFSERFYLKKNSKNIAAIQLKTGYSFLINAPSIIHLDGPDEHRKEINSFKSGGILFAIEFILFLKWNDVF